MHEVAQSSAVVLQQGMLQKLEQDRAHCQRVAQVAIQAMDEQSRIHGYSVFKALLTLSGVEEIKKRASVSRELSPEELAFVEERASRYLHQMSLLATDASETLTQQISQILSAPGGERPR